MLCGQGEVRSFVHPINWQQSQVDVLSMWDASISMTDCVCKSCGDDIKKNGNKQSYVPRWIKRVKTVRQCVVDHCGSKAAKNCSLGSLEQIQTILSCGLKCSHSDTAIPLCFTHYNKYYAAMTTQKCAGCGANPSKGKKFNHHCPNPDLVNKFLTSHTDFHEHMKASDLLCKSCYNFFHRLVSNCEHDNLLQLLITTSYSIALCRKTMSQTPFQTATVEGPCT